MPKFAPLLAAGWEVIPLSREDGKKPLVSGYHGADHSVADKETVKGWARQWPDANPAIVMPPGVIGLDVDNHDADGLEALNAFEREHGKLPYGPRIFHGYIGEVNGEPEPSPYGTMLFRIPESLLAQFGPRKIVGNLNKVTGKPGVDVIAPWLRYNVAPGAVHRSGEVYEWAWGSSEVLDYMPTPDDIPYLTEDQARALFTRTKADRVADTAAPSHGVKPLVPAEPILDAKSRGSLLLKQVRELALLDEGQTMLIEGEERGWQNNNGFFVLACALVRLCHEAGKDEDAIGRKFVQQASAGLDELDAERQWENAILAVMEDDLPADPAVYAASSTQDPYAFAAEMVEREFTDENGVLVLRYKHDEREFWLWQGRYYEHLNDEQIVGLVKMRLHGKFDTFMSADGPDIRPIKVKERLANELVAHLKTHTGRLRAAPAVGGVPFRNGWLNVSTGNLEPLTPARDVRWVVPADYDPDAHCPQWLKFLDSLGWTDETAERRLIQQIIGYILSGRKDHEKGVLLLGPSRSGKGTIIHVLHALMGEGAVGTTLDSLTRNFGLQNFIGKGLATIGDARFGKSDKNLNGLLLSLTSNDELPIDVKYGKPLSLNLPARLVIATNETPNFIEVSDALGMRFLVVKFHRSFAGHEDRDLGKRLRRELPGIARWALDGLADLDKTDEFAETEAGKAVQRQMIEESSFVRMFVTEMCELGADYRISNEDLYDAYSTWAVQNGMQPYNSVKFGKDLMDAFTGQVEQIVYRVGRKSVRGKSGLRLA